MLSEIIYRHGYRQTYMKQENQAHSNKEYGSDAALSNAGVCMTWRSVLSLKATHHEGNWYRHEARKYLGTHMAVNAQA